MMGVKTVKEFGQSFEISQSQLANLLAAICNLQIGDSVSTNIGTLIKTSDTEFKIEFTGKHMSSICESFSSG
jgi:dolichol kinase